jgi:hypothetical protein
LRQRNSAERDGKLPKLAIHEGQVWLASAVG